ncbi:unnamed protein product [Anisakis simplex]|uniref:Methyl-accepting chemotaxis protein n=1 Tax=Anisakis simplex TaxID=6269 RepID=A0A0M3K127_ANISI|nr:unnamed protein product [Anisakis simplex]
MEIIFRSAILENTPLTKQSKTASTSLIDTYSTRRRSVIPRDLKADNTDTDTDTTTPFEHSSLDDEAIEEMNSIKISERLEGMRSRLDATMNSIPNQSPKKKVSVESEKTDLLNESRRLAGACKALVRAVNGEEERQLATITHEIVESADHLTSTTQQIIQHSNSVFSAQLMTAKTDQMLKSLIETLALVEEVRVLENASSSDAMKTLTSRSTTLAAQITQLIQAVRNL